MRFLRRLLRDDERHFTLRVINMPSASPIITKCAAAFWFVQAQDISFAPVSMMSSTSSARRSQVLDSATIVRWAVGGGPQRTAVIVPWRSLLTIGPLWPGGSTMVTLWLGDGCPGALLPFGVPGICGTRVGALGMICSCCSDCFAR